MPPLLLWQLKLVHYTLNQSTSLQSGHRYELHELCLSLKPLLHVISKQAVLELEVGLECLVVYPNRKLQQEVTLTLRNTTLKGLLQLLLSLSNPLSVRRRRSLLLSELLQPSLSVQVAQLPLLLQFPLSLFLLLPPLLFETLPLLFLHLLDHHKLILQLGVELLLDLL